MTEDLDPTGIVAMNGSCQLGFSCFPLIGRFKMNFGNSVVNNGKSTHPEVIDQPGHEPKLHKAPNPCGNNQRGENNRRENNHRRD